MKALYIGVVAGVALAGLAACSDSGEKPGANQPPPPVEAWQPQIHAYQNVWRLNNQGWDDGDAAWYYNLTQGSQVVEYDIFKALERPASAEPFRGDGLARFGYLNQLTSSGNPDALPVGFAKDQDHGRAWLGMTCAACHTNRMEINGKVVQVDGAPTLGDLAAFLTELRDSLKATQADPAKFQRLQWVVLGKHPFKFQIKKLHQRLQANLDHVQQIVTDSQTDAPWGPARLDAFGMIFNRVAEVDLGYAPNRQTPNAPVSYPHIWDTGRFDWVQWNAVVPNKTDTEKLGRNTGEVLGVFGTAKLKKPTLLHYFYDSTARIQNLKDMEVHVERLNAPKWEEVVGRLDPEKVARGKKLYDSQGCQACHQIINSLDHSAPIVVNQTPVSVLKTDPTMAENAGRMVHSRQLSGVAMPPIIGTPLKPVDSGVNLLTNAVGGVVFKSIIDPANTLATYEDKNAANSPGWQKAAQVDWNNYKNHKSAQQSQLDAEMKAFDDKQRDRQAQAVSQGPVYKGRPLDGIWATAPYLHNGSVPNLYQLLLPQAQRASSFKVGGMKFDPVNVGFDLADGLAILDTTKPANSNAGHDYGTNLSDAERWDLVEYLKSL